MALLSLHEIVLSFGAGPLLDGVNLNIQPGDRLCLLGRNGAGKSTLLKIIERSLRADGGTIAQQPGTRIALLSQNVPADLSGTVRDVVGTQVSGKSTGPPVIDIALSKMQLEPEADFASLSVGLKRRALLARALATEPDLLLLDEPTNHLDIQAIEWLESFLLKRRGSLLFVTHDRALTHRLATRILELDRGKLSSWACDYATFLRRRESQLEAEQRQDRQFDDRLKQEEAWIRQGIQARRTRNEGRVRALFQMREERRLRRSATGGARVEVLEGQQSSRRVIEAEDLTFAYGDNIVLRPFSTTIMRGDKVGFIGPNGAGKTTLLRLLLGDLAPDGGTLKHGLRLEVAYFDQLRAQLDDEQTVFNSVANGNDRVEVNGGTRHVFAYLQDFLFTKAQTQCKVSVLSGGERNRLLLARLFTRPANVLALDEPTNDLDAETLEVLEAMLVDFAGTVLFVSHDREFLDNVATSTIVFDGFGQAHEHVGGYSDWLRHRPAGGRGRRHPGGGDHHAQERERHGRPRPGHRHRNLDLAVRTGHRARLLPSVAARRDESSWRRSVGPSSRRGTRSRNRRGLHRIGILRIADESRSRLCMESIDLVQFHGLPPVELLDEAFETLMDLKARGWARFVGVSANGPAGP